MPVNKNALLRYRTIDKCLRNRYRKWTLDDLIEACSDALYEYTGKMDDVSRRTIQLDIQKMRSEELGYRAPIIVKENKYYEYEDPDYSITNAPLSDQDMEMMSGAVAVIKQLSGFSAFSGMEDIVGKLEDYVGASKQDRDPAIIYENNESLRGLNHIPSLYDAIIGKRPILIRYQSFKSKDPQEFIFSPYCLKEFRNRWFVYGKQPDSPGLYNLALDRILSLSEAPKDTRFIYDFEFDPKTYFDNMVGVTKDTDSKTEKILFKVVASEAPYVETKPLHKSQTVVERCDDGSVIFQIEVVLNFEIERDLISFCEGIQVLSPEPLVQHIRERLCAAAQQYDTL